MKNIIKSKRIIIPIILCIALIWIPIAIIEHRMSSEIIEAIREGKDVEYVEELIEKSWNLNALNTFSFMKYIDVPVYPPIIKACEESNYEVVEILIENGASVNYVRGAIASPITIVISHLRNVDYPLLKLLLENGADPNEPVNGYYPIIKVCSLYAENYEGQDRQVEEEKLLDAIKLLIEYGAEVKVVEYGANAIHKLAFYNNITCMEFIVENYEFDLNFQNVRGETALMLAGANIQGGSECIEFLLKQGARKDIVSDDGKTAYDYAIEAGNYNCAELLK